MCQFSSQGYGCAALCGRIICQHWADMFQCKVISFSAHYYVAYIRGVATGGISVFLTTPPPKSVYLKFFMWLFCLLDPGQIRYRAIYTHPNQIPDYASGIYVMKIGMGARMYDTDQNASASTEAVNRVPRPVRKISTPLMPPMYGMNENKASFWKLLLTSDKPVPQSPVLYF